MDLHKYRNCINNLIKWEWETLKKLRRKKRKNILLRGSFAIFCLSSILFCVFLPTLSLEYLLRAIGIPYAIVICCRIISFFTWLWFITPINKLSKKGKDEKKKK